MTPAVLTPQAQVGFERLQTLINVDHVLGRDAILEGVAITGQDATLALRVAGGRPHELKLQRPEAAPRLGRYFGLAPPVGATATMARLRPRLAEALDRAFDSDPWQGPIANPGTPPPAQAPGPPLWLVGVAMVAVLAAVAALIWR